MEAPTTEFIMTLLIWAFGVAVSLFGAVGLYLWHIRGKEKGWDESKKDVADIKTDITEIKENVGYISGVLRAMTADKPASSISGDSPLSLNRLGQSINDALDADSLARKYRKLFNIKEDASAYDIQESCLHFSMRGETSGLGEKIDGEDMARIKKYAFGKGIDINTIFAVIAILVRNKILKERNINIAEVDKK